MQYLRDGRVNFTVASQMHCQMVSYDSLTKEKQDPSSTQPASSFCSLGVPGLFPCPEGKLLSRVILETRFWFSRRNPNSLTCIYSALRQHSSRDLSPCQCLACISWNPVVKGEFQSQSWGKLPSAMDASESVSHACAEAAGTAGPVYTTGSIFNTKNMSVTGAHFIRTFFFFFYCAFVERRKLKLF